MTPDSALITKDRLIDATPFTVDVVDVTGTLTGETQMDTSTVYICLSVVHFVMNLTSDTFLAFRSFSIKTNVTNNYDFCQSD